MNDHPIPVDARRVAADAATRLRAVLAAIEAGDIDATPEQIAFLDGAAVAAESLSSGDRR